MPAALSAPPVGVPSSHQCLGAPRRRLPKDDAAPCPTGEVQGRGYPKPCAPGEPVRAGALGWPAGEVGSTHRRRAAPSSLDAPSASCLWIVVLAAAPFWWWSGETRWRSRRTPALNPGRDPPPIDRSLRGSRPGWGTGDPAGAVLYLGEPPWKVETCAVTGLRAVGFPLQVKVRAGAGQPHPCAPWPWPRRPVSFACRRPTPQPLLCYAGLGPCS
jgi:hypothetical protein